MEKAKLKELLLDRVAGARPWVDIAPFAIYQDVEELSAFLAYVGDLDGYLEIGSASGAMLDFMLNTLKVKAYGIDINPPARAALKKRMFLGDSSSKEALAWARKRGPFDLIFIDGGRDYEQVKQDYELYAPLARKFIGFHDIVHDTWTGVRRFWEEALTTLPGGKQTFVNPSIIGLGIGLIVKEA
jgi:hypothetical protein